MNNTGKKVGYLKGLLESLPQDDSVSGKLLRGVVDLLGDLSDRADVVDEVLDDLNSYVESIDDDLSALEENGGHTFTFHDDEDEDDIDFDDDFDDAEDRLHVLRPETPAAPASDALAGVLCPECRRMFFVSLDDPEGSVYACPHCAETVTPEPLTPENAPIAKPKN